MKNKYLNSSFRIFLGFFCFLSVFYSVFSTVEVFSNYNTELIVTSNNTIDIHKHLTIKNVYEVGIVPGQIEFKVGKGTEGSIGNIEILDAKAFDAFGNQIKTQVRTTPSYTIIILDVYYPLLPGFEYSFNLSYVMSYEPSGIFFKSLQIPLRESTIPIQNGEFKVVLPDNYYFTYLSSEGDNTIIEKNIASWNIKDNIPNSVIFEYSYIPIRLGSFKGSYVFWIGINLVLFMILVLSIRREIKKFRDGQNSDGFYDNFEGSNTNYPNGDSTQSNHFDSNLNNSQNNNFNYHSSNHVHNNNNPNLNNNLNHNSHSRDKHVSSGSNGHLHRKHDGGENLHNESNKRSH